MNQIKKLKNNPVLKSILFIIISFLFAVNIRLIIKPSNMLPGGLSGVTLLIQQVFMKFCNFEPSFMVVNILLNLIPIYIGFRYIGVKFTLYSCIIVIGSSIFVDVIPPLPSFTNEMILFAIFGGCINGLLVSICLLLGGTSGGTDFISIYFSEKKGKDVWDYILVFDAIILLIAGSIFGIERALYSIIFQFTSTQTIKMIYRRYQKSTLFIITSKPKEVYEKILEISNHTGTLLEGKGCYNGEDVQIVYSVIDDDLVNKITREIYKIDKKSFVNVIKTDQINGNFNKRPTE